MQWIDIRREPPKLYKMYLVTDGLEVFPGYFSNEGTCGICVVPYTVDNCTRTWNPIHKPLLPTHYLEMPEPPTNLLPQSTEYDDHDPILSYEEMLDKKCQEFLDEATEENLESILEETTDARTVNAPEV